MKQEERELWKAAKLSSEKGVLNLEKAELLLTDLLEEMDEKKQAHPELYAMLDLQRIWNKIRDIRLQIRETRKVWGHLKWAVGMLEKRREKSDAEYRYTPAIRAVADSAD